MKSMGMPINLINLCEEGLFYCIKCLVYYYQKAINNWQGNGCSNAASQNMKTRWKAGFRPSIICLKHKRFVLEWVVALMQYHEDFNLVIEFDGIQHFEPMEAWGGVEKFSKVHARHRQKDEYWEIIEMMRLWTCNNHFQMHPAAMWLKATCWSSSELQNAV